MAQIRSHAEDHSDDIIAAPGPEREALAVINAYQDAWNLRDLEAMDATFHFPHARIASGKVSILQPMSRHPQFFDAFIEQICAIAGENGSTVESGGRPEDC